MFADREVFSGEASSRECRLPNALARLLLEPIIQFLLIGFAIWLIATCVGSDQQRYRIEIGEAQVDRLAKSFANQVGQPPTPKQLRILLDRYVADEIAYREGKAMGLDKDDEIVRRRIIQKIGFLSSDHAVPDVPSEDQLLRWYASHQYRYREPGRTSFVHIYFSPDQGGDAAARQRAQRVLQNLSSVGNFSAEGDTFPGPAQATAATREEIVRIFGSSPVADTLPRLMPGRWAGPYRSGYGWHLVRVDRRMPPDTPPLAAIRERVSADYVDAERARLNSVADAKLRVRYSVIFPGTTL